jgi:hypothetical protein
MRSQSPSLAPSRHANDVTVHIVLDDFGSFGLAYVERLTPTKRPSLRTSSQANIQTQLGSSRSTRPRGGRAT